MDNKIFNVNGVGDERLLDTLKLAFGSSKVTAWQQTEDSGLILLWHNEGGNELPAPVDANGVLPLVKQWLDGDFAKKVKFGEMCEKYRGGDVDNEYGWQVYCEAWGHVGGNHYAICGVRPAWAWLGK